MENGAAMTSGKELSLNDRAAALIDGLCARAEELDVQVVDAAGARIVDCGIHVRGGIEAGILLARACLSDRGSVTLETSDLAGRPCPRVGVQVDRPAIACLWSQYAGWPIVRGKYFAMGSGPMRVVRGKEKMLDQAGYREAPRRVVGILETGRLPDAATVEWMARELTVQPSQLTVLAARTASLAGCLQVVARSLETCMHKLYEIGFPVEKVIAGCGRAFLPPVPIDDLVAIGRTNDSILYGGEVFLWVDVAPGLVEELGPKVPSSASSDYGAPFAEIFKRCGGDFYKIDPMLFSPAVVSINNLSDGSTSTFGKAAFDLVAKSFFG